MVNDNCIKVSILTNNICHNIDNNLLLNSISIPLNFNLNNDNDIKFLKKIVVKSKYYIILHILSSVRYKYIQYYFNQ